MKKTIIYLLIFSMLLWIPSCGALKNDSYSFSLNLNEMRKLYKAAIESEEAYAEALAEISPDMECERDAFLELLEQFKDHVVIFVPNSLRYIQYEINFEFEGSKVDTEEGASQKTSVNMIRQKYTRRTDSCRAGGTFYSSSSPEPLYDDPMQKMVQDGTFAVEGDVKSRFDMNGYLFKEAYIHETAEYNLYYFTVYSSEDAYVGALEFKAYKEEDGKIPYFSWSDFYFFSFMTLGEYVSG